MYGGPQHIAPLWLRTELQPPTATAGAPRYVLRHVPLFPVLAGAVHSDSTYMKVGLSRKVV